MKVADVIARVRDQATRARGPESAGDQELTEIIGWTLRAVGLEVANDGEVYSPAPPPSLVIPNVPAMNAARYGGRKRRR